MTTTLKDLVSTFEFDSKFFIASNRTQDLQEYAMYFFDAYDVTVEDFDYQKVSDYVSEWADGMVDVYYHDLWETAKEYQDFTADAISEYGADIVNEKGLEGLFAVGQYEYYYQLAYSAIQQLETYVESLETVTA